MRRPPHRGQNPRPLHEKATKRSSPQAAQRKRANPAARQPHRRKSRNSCSTNRGSLPRLEATPRAHETSRNGPARCREGCPMRDRAARMRSMAVPRAVVRRSACQHSGIRQSGANASITTARSRFLPTGVAADSRSARDRSHVGHLFGATLRCRRAKSGATAVTNRAPLNFFSAAVSRMSPRWRSIAEDSSERQEREDSPAKALRPKPLHPEVARHHQLRKTRESGSIPVAR